jgi:hypothetical protein
MAMSDPSRRCGHCDKPIHREDGFVCKICDRLFHRECCDPSRDRYYLVEDRLLSICVDCLAQRLQSGAPSI